MKLYILPLFILLVVIVSSLSCAHREEVGLYSTGEKINKNSQLLFMVTKNSSPEINQAEKLISEECSSQAKNKGFSIISDLKECSGCRAIEIAYKEVSEKKAEIYDKRAHFIVKKINKNKSFETSKTIAVAVESESREANQDTAFYLCKSFFYGLEHNVAQKVEVEGSKFKNP